VTSTQLLIGGRWTAARSGDTEEIRSPYDGSVVGEVREIGIAAAGGERPSGRADRHRHHPEPGVAGGGGE
jgi:hypothetical protein